MFFVLPIFYFFVKVVHSVSLQQQAPEPPTSTCFAVQQLSVLYEHCAAEQLMDVSFLAEGVPATEFLMLSFRLLKLWQYVSQLFCALGPFTDISERMHIFFSLLIQFVTLHLRLLIIYIPFIVLIYYVRFKEHYSKYFRTSVRKCKKVKKIIEKSRIYYKKIHKKLLLFCVHTIIIKILSGDLW